jgi:hypothetical protein
MRHSNNRSVQPILASASASAPVNAKKTDDECRDTLVGLPNTDPSRRCFCIGLEPFRDPTAGLTYVLLAWVFCVAMYLILLTWIYVTLWGVSDGYNSLLPVISLGLAKNPAIQGVFIMSIALQFVIYLAFWMVFDDTLDRVKCTLEVRTRPNRHPRTQIAMQGMWWARAVALGVRQGSLVIVGSCNMFDFSFVHGLFVLVALVAHFIYESLSLVQRGWYIFFFRPCAVHVALWVIELAFLPTMLASLICFRAHGDSECLGGDGAVTAYEAIMFCFVPVTVAFLVLDLCV